MAYRTAIDDYYVWGTSSNGQLGVGYLVQYDSPTSVSCPTTLSIENNSQTNFSLYPNPSHDKTILELGETFNQVTVSISNLQGKEVYHKDFHQTNQINLEFLLQAGLYLVNISTDNQLKTIKMFVE